MKPQSVIFIGRSGSGKGTQAELLMNLFKEKDASRGIIYIQSGQELRDFIKGKGYTQEVCKKLYDTGGLIPEFLVVHLWAQKLVDTYTGKEHIVCDGMPRKVHEAGALHSVFGFYGLSKPWVVYLDIDDEHAVDRLLKRGRFDDKKEEIEKRLEWYQTQVVPTINFYRGNPDYNFLDVDGRRPIPEIHADIVKRLGLS